MWRVRVKGWKGKRLILCLVVVVVKERKRDGRKEVLLKIL